MNLDLIPDPILGVAGPASIHPRVTRALTRLTSHRCAQFRRLYSETIEYLRQVIKTNGEVYLLTASGTGAVEAMIMNLIRPEDTVIIPIFGSFSKRLARQAERVCKNVVTISYSFGEVPTFEKIKHDVESLNIKNIDVVALVYNETNPGTTLRDLPKIAKWFKDKGALVLVDNVSALGGDYYEMDKWHIDVTASSSQKCLGAPPVMSFIAVNDEALKKIENNSTQTTYFDLKIYRKFSQKMETPFTPSVNLIYALREALKIIITEIGLENWIRWHLERARAIHESLVSVGLKPYVDNGNYRSNTVLPFYYPENISSKEFINRLERKYYTLISDAMDEIKGRVFRVGNMGYLTRREVLTLITSITAILLELNVKVDLNGLEKALRIINNYWEPFTEHL